MNNWKIIRLGDAATFINGFAFKPSHWSETGKEIIRIQNLTNSSSKSNFYDGELPEKYLVKKGDLLISWSATLGVYEWEKESAWLNQHIFKVVFDKENYDKNFFKYLISSSLKKMKEQVHGATMKHITKKRFDAFQIPLPPLETQKKIAAILDAADALRQKTRQIIQEYDQLAQAIFLDMFGDPVTNPMGWEVKKLDDTSLKVTDGEHGTVERLKKGKMYLMAKNVGNGGLNLNEVSYISEDDHTRIYKRCNPEEGDLLLVCVGATIGRCCLVPRIEQFSLARSVALIKPNKTEIDSSFLIYQFKHERFQNQIMNRRNTSAQAGLYIGQIKKLDVIIPPFSIQTQFSEKIALIEHQKELAKNSLAESEDLFNALLQKAFKGELVKA
jgi:type I restriction enzyme S subunit